MNKTFQTSQTGSNMKPETRNLKPEGFTFPPSVQVDLFNYLKPKQRAILKPYLRIIKRPYQEKLCVSLLDYLEGRGLDTHAEPVMALFQGEIVRVCNLRPLTHREVSSFRNQDSRFRFQGSREPKSIGTVIKQLFPNLSHLKHETGEAL